MHFTTRRLVVGAVVGAVALAVVSATLGGLIGAGLHSGADDTSKRPAASGAGCDVAEVSARVLPSLVTVHVRGSAGSGNGSGSVLDQQGNILTNDHVIASAVPGGTVTVDFARGYTQVA